MGVCTKTASIGSGKHAVLIRADHFPTLSDLDKGASMSMKVSLTGRLHDKNGRHKDAFYNCTTFLNQDCNHEPFSTHCSGQNQADNVNI